MIVEIIDEGEITGSYRIQQVRMRISNDEEWVHITQAVTLEGAYIGDVDTAIYICDSMGIKPELRTPESNVCSIGFCESEQKWYGWSHRAIYGYGIGDILDKGSCGAGAFTSLPVIATDLDIAELMARAFAEGVS